MIIHESRKGLYLVFVFMVILIAQVDAQLLQPAPPFDLLNSGYGAAALGIGGAFVAVATDATAIYWNPAGLAQLNGLQIFADYRYQGDSDEDIAAEVFPNEFQSPQRYSVTGKQFQAAGFSYTFTTPKYAFAPGFAWQRRSAAGPVRELKEAAGFVEFLTNTFFVQSEGTFTQKLDGGEEEFVFAMSARASNRILIGGTWSFLRGTPQETVSGQYHESVNLPLQRRSTDLTLEQTRSEEFSGNYLKVGILLYPTGGMSVGGYVRFPYTRESELTLQRSGPFQSVTRFLDEGGNTIREEMESGSVQQTGTARAELEVPLEYSFGVALRPRPTFLIAGSITYADWSDAQLVVSDSSDLEIIPESALPFPTLRTGGSPQPALLQWRGGIEYLMGSYGNGIVLRSGYFRDGQPYSTANGEREYFRGYTFGAGYVTRAFRFDAAYVRETGDLTFTTTSREASSFRNRRWVFTLSLMS